MVTVTKPPSSHELVTPATVYEVTSYADDPASAYQTMGADGQTVHRRVIRMGGGGGGGGNRKGDAGREE